MVSWLISSTNLRIESECLSLKCANHSGQGVCRSPCGEQKTTEMFAEEDQDIYVQMYHNAGTGTSGDHIKSRSQNDPKGKNPPCFCLSFSFLKCLKG